jgi:hypothetical protein
MRGPSRQFAKKNSGMTSKLAIDATRFHRTHASRMRTAGPDSPSAAPDMRWSKNENAREDAGVSGSKARSSKRPGPHRRRISGGLLLVTGALQQLPLLVLAHLLAALLDHTAHWKSPWSTASSAPPFRGLVPAARTARSPHGRAQRLAGVRARGGLEARAGAVKRREHGQNPSRRSTKRLRTLPSIRFTTCRRGRNGRIGRRRIPRWAIASRIAACPGSIICPRLR